MKHALASTVYALLLSPLFLSGCAKAEKAAPVVVTPGATQEQHRQVERAAAKQVQNSDNLNSAFRDYGRGDYPSALTRFKRAAADGDARAAYYVGVMHSNGEGVKRDLAESAKWYQRAADLGNADGMYSLARLYVIGSGVPQDTQKALELYERAAETYPPGDERERATEQRLAIVAVLDELKKSKSGSAEPQ